MRLVRLLMVFALCLPATGALAQTGKIAGQVTDATSGMPLPGVNVVIEGTTQGSVTDAEGYYTIIGVRPGTFDVRASFIGYTPQVQEDVRVNIDLTTTLDFQLLDRASNTPIIGERHEATLDSSLDELADVRHAAGGDVDAPHRIARIRLSEQRHVLRSARRDEGTLELPAEAVKGASQEEGLANLDAIP